MKRFCFILASVIALISAAKLPSYITPCSQSQPFDLISKCVLDQAKKAQPYFAKGIPELNVESIDPLTLPNVNAVAGTFSIKSTNVVVKGLGKIEIKDIKIDLKENEGVITIFGNFSFSSDYETMGNVLLIPITGKGKLSVKMYDTEIQMKFTIKKVVGDDGAEHLKTHNLRFTQKYGICKFHLTNLLGGAEIGDSVNKVLNDNWRDIMAEVGEPFIRAVIDRVHEIINVFFSKVPFEEMSAP